MDTIYERKVLIIPVDAWFAIGTTIPVDHIQVLVNL